MFYLIFFSNLNERSFYLWFFVDSAEGCARLLGWAGQRGLAPHPRQEFSTREDEEEEGQLPRWCHFDDGQFHSLWWLKFTTVRLDPPRMRGPCNCPPSPIPVLVCCRICLPLPSDGLLFFRNFLNMKFASISLPNHIQSYSLDVSPYVAIHRHTYNSRHSPAFWWTINTSRLDSVYNLLSTFIAFLY